MRCEQSFPGDDFLAKSFADTHRVSPRFSLSAAVSQRGRETNMGRSWQQLSDEIANRDPSTETAAQVLADTRAFKSMSAALDPLIARAEEIKAESDALTRAHNAWKASPEYQRASKAECVRRYEAYSKRYDELDEEWKRIKARGREI